MRNMSVAKNCAVVLNCCSYVMVSCELLIGMCVDRDSVFGICSENVVLI